MGRPRQRLTALIAAAAFLLNGADLFGASAGENFRTDINASGSTNASDIGQAKANAGHTLPPEA